MYSGYVLSITLLLLLLPSASYASVSRSRYKRKLQFSPPCPEENYRFDKETGNFLCLVPTGKVCFELCQKQHCNEWSAFNFMYSKDTKIRHRQACRSKRGYGDIDRGGPTSGRLKGRNSGELLWMR
ncbi:unnamed protein product [Dibothriocephalus latus]|uniref:Apple domain-containing protein n=1 Tax=Dibothriocephalus latus TaxID=60516 RepID=A0A3P7RD07_DIBLA|nr:unnamed protein product [Dibothriocephalus latus]